jgi:hypothetical protein
MKASEILRGLSDMIARAEQGDTGTAGDNRLTPVSVDNTDHTDDAVMISPLQQKQELLKKAAGVESFYDQDGACEHCGQEPCACEHDPLDALKHNAGIPVVIQDIGGEENDIV